LEKFTPYINFSKQLEKSISPEFFFADMFFYGSEYEIIKFKYDSNMKPTSALKLGEKRLLETDNPLYLPVGVPISFLVTSSDVLHSWAVLSLGIKIDAVPGRLNQVISLIDFPGVFFGQCSELCGINHGFMPICIKAKCFEGGSYVSNELPWFSDFLKEDIKRLKYYKNDWPVV
jgi:hypothetical protein